MNEQPAPDDPSQDELVPQLVGAKTLGRERVFGSKTAADQPAGYAHCPACREDFPYRARDIGRVVRCPACNTGSIRLGATLLQKEAVLEGGEEESPTVVPLPPRRWAGWALLVVPLLAAVLVGGSLLFTSSLAVTGDRRWLPFGAAPPMAPSREGTRAPDEHGKIPPPPEEITLEAIEALLKCEDRQEALLKAQVWEQLLLDFGVPKSDPRLLRLAAIIEKLSAELAPKPVPPPAYVEEFRRAMQELREALVNEDLLGARRAMQRVRELLAAHPDDLEHFTKSLLVIQQRLEQLELLLEGHQRVTALLDETAEAIRADRPTAAAEKLAQAKFIGLKTPMDDSEYEALSRRVRALERDLRFVRGKRAVEDAERCQKENDLRARNAQLDVAFAILPDLPASRVRDLLTRADKLYDEPIASPAASALGAELAFREAYEEALQYYGRVKTLPQLADACVEAHRRFEAAGQLPREEDEKIAGLILTALKFEVTDLTSRPTTAPDVAPGLAMARIALDEASPWDYTKEWETLNEMLLAKGDEVALSAIGQAKAAAAEERFEAAVRLVEPAFTLGHDDLRDKARGLRQGWEKDIERRAYLAEQDALWNEAARAYKDKQYLEAWALLHQFIQRYPDSPKMDQAERARASLRGKVETAAEEAVGHIRAYEQEENWPGFRAAVEQLESAPLTDGERQVLAGWQVRLDELDKRADGLFAQTEDARRFERPSDDAVIQLIKIMPQVLYLNPNHEEASNVLERAREDGEARAQAMVVRAKLVKKSSLRIYRERLQKAVQLNPDGPYGKEARELLGKR